MQDYKFFAGADSAGNDLMQLQMFSNQPSQLASICTSNPACVAFNTNGWLKTKVSPQEQFTFWTSNPNAGLFVKNSALPSVSTSQPTSLQNLYNAGQPTSLQNLYVIMDRNAKIAYLPELVGNDSGYYGYMVDAFTNRNPSVMAFLRDGNVSSDTINNATLLAQQDRTTAMRLFKQIHQRDNNIASAFVTWAKAADSVGPPVVKGGQVSLTGKSNTTYLVVGILLLLVGALVGYLIGKKTCTLR